MRLELPETSVLFSGDLGRRDHPLLKDRGTPRGASYVICESTDGDREHLEIEPPRQVVDEAITRTVAASTR